ncbi:MAG: InlB B-repeat-containing protein [Candidatus Micrarchaeia archaeon]
MKSQSAIEFMITYSWAFLIIALFIAVALTALAAKNPASYSPQACYLQPELPCYQSEFMANATSSNYVVIFLNNIGPTMKFIGASLHVNPTISSGAYPGMCLPANAPEGATVICNATMNGYAPSIGTQVNPRFVISYQICQPSCATYNTSGSSSNIVAQYKSNIAEITLLTGTGSGSIDIGGIGYPSNTNVYAVIGKPYYLYAVPPTGYTFGNWVVSGGISINSTTSQTAQITVSSTGNVIANFVA